ncbi:MAG: ArsR/SmtB family transcription factor [Longimicrobiales bacterium]
MSKLTPELMNMVAERFRALGEPARLRILDALRAGELTVSQIMVEAELSQANVSKHLHLLHSLGFVSRRKEGLFVYYALADRDPFRLCDIICGRLARESAARQKLMARTV